MTFGRSKGYQGGGAPAAVHRSSAKPLSFIHGEASGGRSKSSKPSKDDHKAAKEAQRKKLKEDLKYYNDKLLTTMTDHHKAMSREVRSSERKEHDRVIASLERAVDKFKEKIQTTKDNIELLTVDSTGGRERDSEDDADEEDDSFVVSDEDEESNYSDEESAEETDGDKGSQDSRDSRKRHRSRSNDRHRDKYAESSKSKRRDSRSRSGDRHSSAKKSSRDDHRDDPRDTRRDSRREPSPKRHRDSRRDSPPPRSSRDRRDESPKRSRHSADDSRREKGSKSRHRSESPQHISDDDDRGDDRRRSGARTPPPAYSSSKGKKVEEDRDVEIVSSSSVPGGRPEASADAGPTLNGIHHMNISEITRRSALQMKCITAAGSKTIEESYRVMEEDRSAQGPNRRPGKPLLLLRGLMEMGVTGHPVTLSVCPLPSPHGSIGVKSATGILYTQVYTAFFQAKLFNLVSRFGPNLSDVSIPDAMIVLGYNDYQLGRLTNTLRNYEASLVSAE